MAKLKNLEIRNAAKAKDVPLWMVADEMGMCIASMTRYLHYERTPKEKREILQIIEKLSAEEEREES